MNLDPIDELEARLGVAPRNRVAFGGPPVGGITPLHVETRRQWHGIVGNGRLSLGALIHANTLLFEPGEHFSVLAAVSTEDRVLRAMPWRLSEIGARVASFHRSRPDPERSGHVRFTRELVLTGERYYVQEPVPAELTSGRRVFMHTIAVWQERLPGRRLAGRLFPLVIGTNGRAILVPADHWTPWFLSRWHE